MPDETLIIAVIGFAGSGGLAAIVTALLNRRWKKQDDKVAEAKNVVTAEQHKEVLDKISDLHGIVKDQNMAVQAQIGALSTAHKTSMVERITYLGTCYLKAGEISLNDKTIVKNMYKAYKGIGGNGDLESVMEEIDKLPVVDKYHVKPSSGHN